MRAKDELVIEAGSGMEAESLLNLKTKSVLFMRIANGFLFVIGIMLFTQSGLRTQLLGIGLMLWCAVMRGIDDLLIYLRNIDRTTSTKLEELEARFSQLERRAA